jgi:acyl carrier protein
MNPDFVKLLAPFLPLLRDRTLTEDMSLRDLGLDSMKSIDLLFGIEDVFGIALPDEDLNDHTFATAGNLWSAVANALGARVAS